MLDVDIRSLRLFVAVCDVGNMRQAAEQENVEPSTISKRIAQLEERLGLPVLERGRRGVCPTPLGQAVLEHARSVLFTLDRMRADASAFMGGVKGQVKVAGSASALAQALLDDIAGFSKEAAHSDIRVSVQECLSSDVVKQVRDGEASLGICWDTQDFGDLAKRSYRSDELVLAVHDSHPLAGQERLSFADTLAYDYTGPQPTSSLHGILNRAAAVLGREMNCRVVVNSFESALRAVAVNQCLAVIPRQLVLRSARDGVRAVRLQESWAERRFVICYRNDESLSPSALYLLDYLGGMSDMQEHVAPPEVVSTPLFTAAPSRDSAQPTLANFTSQMAQLADAFKSWP